MAEKRVLDALARIYRMAEAGERGFSTASTNANSRALKLLLKSFARQRARFKQEILDEIERLGGSIRRRHSILGMIHRGRVAIFTAMTIEDDKRQRVILKEAAFGENFAVRAYQRALKLDLPPETHELVSRQYEKVQNVVDQIHLMLGKDGKRQIVCLYDSEWDANAAVQSLRRAGFAGEGIQIVPLDLPDTQYNTPGTTVPETFLSGMVGGVVWGSLIGALAGLGALQTSIGSDWFGVSSVLGRWALVAVGTTLIASLGGGFIGLVIGMALSEDDSYIYRQSVQQGRYLVNAVVDVTKSNEAGDILDGVNAQPVEPSARAPA